MKAQAQKRAQKKASEILSEGNAYKEKVCIKGANEAQILDIEAENRLKAARVKVAGQILEAETEGAQANNLEGKRKHE